MQEKSKKPSVTQFAKEIKRQTCRKFTSEKDIKIVLEAMRGEEMYRNYIQEVVPGVWVEIIKAGR